MSDPLMDILVNVLVMTPFIIVGMVTERVVSSFKNRNTKNVSTTEIHNVTNIKNDLLDEKTGMIDHKYLPLLEIMKDDFRNHVYAKYSVDQNAYGANMREDKKEV